MGDKKKRESHTDISLDTVLFFMVIGKGVLNGLKYAGNCLKVLRDYILLLDDQRRRKKIKGSFGP